MIKKLLKAHKKGKTMKWHLMINRVFQVTKENLTSCQVIQVGNKNSPPKIHRETN